MRLSCRVAGQEGRATEDSRDDCARPELLVRRGKTDPAQTRRSGFRFKSKADKELVLDSANRPSTDET